MIYATIAAGALAFSAPGAVPLSAVSRSAAVSMATQYGSNLADAYATRERIVALEPTMDAATAEMVATAALYKLSPEEAVAYLQDERAQLVANGVSASDIDESMMIISPAAVSSMSGKVVPTGSSSSSSSSKKKKNKATPTGIFAPAVLGAKAVMGTKELNAMRAEIILQHSKVINSFVDTSESPFGQIALKRLFEAADKDGNGTLDKQEVRAALDSLGFDFYTEKQVDGILGRADMDDNEVIDFEEFVKDAPKTLRTGLVKLAKKNGHDLGFLA